MSATLLDQFNQAFPQLTFLAEELLSTHTYFRIGGPAEVFVSISSTEDLAAVSAYCRKRAIPVTILGGASNVLVSDQPIAGLVIKNVTKNVFFRKFDAKTREVTADSGVLTNLLVRKTIDEELEGLEYFLGIPGSVGGAVYNNAHFMHQLIGERLKEITVLDAMGVQKVHKKEELHFAYDYSDIQKSKDIILTATFVLKKGDKAAIESRAKEATAKRASTQPLGQPSSGCMFQNVTMPDGTRESAGALIDKAGLKGRRVGDAMVSEKHANFIVNVGQASAKDVDQLANEVVRVVKEKFGVPLQREVFSIQ